MKLKNYQIKHIIELLSSLTLKGKLSRRRTEFIKPLLSHYQEKVIQELNNLVNDYAERDENEEIVYINKEQGIVKMKPEYFTEEHDLLNEEYIIELNESNKMTLLTVAEIMLNGDFDVKGEIAEMYDEWCEEFERVIAHYKEKENIEIESVG